jgi:hypothetical protein
MKKTLLAVAASALLAAATLAPTTAQARCGPGCALGFGLLGGIMLGGAIAHSRPYYYDEPVEVIDAPDICYSNREVWSPRRRAYIVQRMRVPCY